MFAICRVVGPSKSALKAMLINLDSDEAMPPLQSGSISPPAHGATSGMIDIHVPDGKFEPVTLLNLFSTDRLMRMPSMLGLVGRQVYVACVTSVTVACLVNTVIPTIISMLGTG